MLRAALVFAICAAACGPSAPHAQGPATHANLAFHDVRVFDGEHTTEHRTVLVAGDAIAAVGAANELAIPAGATVIEGSGGTLLPGLIDAHAHVNGEDDLHAALDFGVTTEIDMYSSPEASVALSRQDALAGAGSAGLGSGAEGRRGSALRARVVPAGYAATTTGGHGTEYGVPVPTLSTPAEAEAFVAARVAEGSHHLKIILETGKELGIPFKSLDEPTTAALVASAHAHHLLAVAHVGDAADVSEALAAGIDGLAHLVPEPLEPAVIAEIVTHHVFVTPTLTVLATICDQHPGLALMKDPRIADALFPDAAHGLASSFPPLPNAHVDCDAAAAQVRALHAAGARLLAGTDAPNPGTAHGASLHDELARLVAAGLSPTDALVAATSAPAAAFQLPNLGVIRAGAAADLILVAGDPTHDITATRALRGVWRSGHALDLAARRAAAATARAAAQAASAHLVGLVSDFDHDDASVKRFIASSDKIQGGTSTSKIELLAPGQETGGAGRALVVSGTVVAPPGDRGWAGVSLALGEQMSPVDLTAAKKLRFWVRGELGTLTLFMITGPHAPSAAKFEVTPEWHEVVIDLTTLGPRDSVILFTWAATAPGPFTFRIDRVSLE
jgi:imidazolonepropionase-like amidohydrolase